MSTPADVRQTDPSRLSGMLAFNGPACPWQSGELEAVLQHQLASPLETALGGGGVRDVAPSTSLRNIADLLHHPQPPVALLQALKSFAKSHVRDDDSVLPREIATLLYYAAIIVARTRCGVRITDLADPDLRRGIEGMLSCLWIDPDTRRLLEEGRGRLQPGAA